MEFSDLLRAQKILAFLLLVSLAKAAEAQTSDQWELDRQMVIAHFGDSVPRLTHPPLLVAIAANGDTYVAMTETYEVVVYDSAGVERARFGRFGTGPGAFRMLAGMGWVGDTLWIADPQLETISLFDRAGRLLTTRRLLSFRAPEGEFVTGSPLAVLGDGSVVAAARAQPRAIAEDGLNQVPVLRLYPGGAMDTVWVRDVRHTVLVLGTTRIRRYTGQPVSDAPIILARPNGAQLVVVDRRDSTTNRETRLRVSWLSASGDTLRIREYPMASPPLPPRLADSLLSWAVDVAMADPAVFASRAEAIAQVGDSLFLPSYLPSVTGALIGSQGAIWLRRPSTAPDSVLWTVLTSEGAVVRTVVAPAKLTLLAVADSVAWGVEPDPPQGTILARYRLVPSGLRPPTF
jgi:hypothetical protein